MRSVRVVLFFFAVIYLLIENGLTVSKTSILRPTFERIFVRRRRALLSPQGTTLKFTVSLSKNLIAKYPRGCNFVLEGAAYYPMPSTREELLPKRLSKPKTKPPVLHKPIDSTYVYIPGSFLRYKAKPVAVPAKVNRIDKNSMEYYYDPKKYQFSNNNSKLYKWTSNKFPNYTNKYEQNHFGAPNTQAKWMKYTAASTIPNWSKNRTYEYNRRNKWQGKERWTRNLEKSHHEYSEYIPMFFDDLEPYQESPHYESIRERRQLFHSFAGIGDVLGFDMKLCLLRAVCESKQFLLPPGYSLAHDILRFLFTFPTIDGLNDEYSRTMKSDYESCDKNLRGDCPFSILDWLLNLK